MDFYSTTHHFMSRSVAAASENRTCTLSSPKNESGIHGSGGIVGGKKGGTVKMDRLVPREKRCSSGSLQARTSSPCGGSSVPNTCPTAGSLVAAHIASEEVEGIRSDFAGDGTLANTPSLSEWEGAIAGISGGPRPLGGCRGRRP